MALKKAIGGRRKEVGYNSSAAGIGPHPFSCLCLIGYYWGAGCLRLGHLVHLCNPAGPEVNNLAVFSTKLLCD